MWYLYVAFCQGKTGFEFNVSVSGRGLQTLTLYGGGSGPIKVTAAVVEAGGHRNGTAAVQVITPRHNDAFGPPDAMYHITFNGPAGAVLAVAWTSNETATDTADAIGTAPRLREGDRSSHFTYTEFPGRNCYHGHGAVDIDTKPVPNLTASISYSM